jgi:recombinational DNA repair protein (RecF pathway)
MSYHIYTTDGIILKRTPFGEANLVLHVLTNDLGLIIASARSARLSVSKLRPALQEYTHVSISCIKGKNGWKITNVVSKGNFFFDYAVHSRRVLSQISSVLLQMIQGETPQKEIFSTIKSGFEFLKLLSDLPADKAEKETAGFEILVVLRLLYQLGYVVKDTNTDIFLKSNIEWNSGLLEEISKNKQQIVGIINRALKESHL